MLSSITYWLLFFFIPIAKTSYFGEPYGIIKWALAYGVGLISVLALFWEQRTIRSLPDNKLFLVGFLFLVFGSAVATLLNFSSITLYHYLDFIYFWLLIAVFLNVIDFNLERVKIPLYTGLVGVMGYALYQLLFGHFIAAELTLSSFNSFFGNNNMVSEYVLLTLPFQIQFILNQNTVRYFKQLIYFIFTTCIVFLVLWHSRSALIAMVLFTAASFWLLKNRLIMIITIIGISFGFLTKNFLSDHLSRNSIQQLESDKKESSAVRKELLLSGLSMAFDQPLGFGAGGYQFNSFPYQKSSSAPNVESIIYKSPHNEFLRLAIEYGVLAPLGVVLIFIFLFIIFFKLEKNEASFFLSFFIIFLIQGLFQFPSENAFSFLLGAFILSLLFSKLPLVIVETKKTVERLFKVLAVALCLILVVTFTSSHYLEFNHWRDKKSQQVACQIYPINWRACMNLVQINLKEKNFSETKKILKKELQQRPFNFVALKFLTITFFEEGNEEKGCKAGYLYDSLFNQKSSWNHYISNRCRLSSLTPVSYLDYKENYQIEINNLLAF